MILTDTAAGTFEPCPAGTYPARLVRLIDMGTQPVTFEGRTTHARKVLLSWEITDPELRRDDDRPYVVSKRYTASLHERASLRRDLAAWRGRDFTAEELKRFDTAALLDAPCLLGVTHTSKGDRTFANVGSLARMPRSMPCPAATEALLHFSLDAFDGEVFDMLGERLQEQIKASPEWQARAAPTAATSSSTAFDDMDDDLPSF